MQHKPAVSWTSGENEFQWFARTGLSHSAVDAQRDLFDIETDLINVTVLETCFFSSLWPGRAALV